jgi:tripartite-type tricarboxylate transporter receptor subunit TctC
MILFRLSTMALVLGLSAAAGAQWKPERPVRLLVPQAPGGAADLVARIITPKLHDALGQPWVLDNRGGAAGNIASEIVARAAPDGHTVFLGLNTMVTVNPSLYKLPFDLPRELMPVARLTYGQYMLLAHPSVKVERLVDFIAQAKARASPFNYSSAGIGSPSHLAMELFHLRAGLTLNHVPYKGGAPATAALLGSEVQTHFTNLVLALPHVKAGRLKALGLSGPKRVALAPEVPTIAEQGYAGFEVTSWYGVFLPGQAPLRIVLTLEEEARKALAAADVIEMMSRQGVEASYLARAPFAEQVRRETATWAQVVREAKIRMD